MAECFNTLPECQKAGDGVGLLMAAKSLEILKGIRLDSPIGAHVNVLGVSTFVTNSQLLEISQSDWLICRCR